MSLETEIQTLNAKIETLTSTVEKLAAAIVEHDIRNLGGDPKEAAQPKKQKADTPKKEEVETEPEQKAEVTHDDLKQLCLDKVREDKSFKETLKAYLDTEFGVKKTGDVPDDKVAEAYDKIKSGEL